VRFPSAACVRENIILTVLDAELRKRERGHDLLGAGD
jgi:hypothetical protein